MKLQLEPYVEINFRSEQEANSYPRYWIRENGMSFAHIWINGEQYIEGFGGGWIKNTGLVSYPIMMKLVRLTKKQDVTVP